MAKKTTDDHRIIKFALEPSDQDMVRLAAALVGTNMADYARQLVLADAQRLTAGIKRPNRSTAAKKT